MSHRLLIVAVPAVIAVVTISGTQPSRVDRMLGFGAGSLPAQRELESKFEASISIDRISAMHRAVSDRPHMAGTPGGRHVATVIRDELRAAGLDADFEEYRAYLSTPREASLRLTAPTPLALRLEEPASPDDPDSRHPDLTPGFCRVFRLLHRRSAPGLRQLRAAARLRTS